MHINRKALNRTLSALVLAILTEVRSLPIWTTLSKWPGITPTCVSTDWVVKATESCAKFGGTKVESTFDPFLPLSPLPLPLGSPFLGSPFPLPFCLVFSDSCCLNRSAVVRGFLAGGSSGVGSGGSSDSAMAKRAELEQLEWQHKNNENKNKRKRHQVVP